MRLNTDLVYVTAVDDQAVVLDSAESTYLTANGTGTLIIEALEAGSTLDALVATVTSEFDIDAETARQDCVSFLNDLEHRGWLLDLDEGDDRQVPVAT